MKNGIIFVLFLVLCFLLTLTPLITEKALFVSNELRDASFDGLIFDDPAGVDHLSITRRLENKNPMLYRYDIQFRYEGDPSSVRILGTPVRQIYFGDGVVPSKSEVRLKGEYDRIGQAIAASSQVATILDGEKFSWTPKSELRLPLDETVEDYAFSVITDPASVEMRKGKPLANVGAFVTNGKVSKFSDALGIKDPSLEPHTSTKTQSGMYVNVLELLRADVQSRVKTVRTLSIAVSVLSALVGFAIIFSDKKTLYPFVYGAMVVFLMAIPSATRQAPTSLATFIVIPLMAYLGYVMYKLMRRADLKVKGIDFRQGSGMALLVFILSTYLFAVLNGFY